MLSRLQDLAGFEAFGADAYTLSVPAYNSVHRLQIWKESPAASPCYTLADAAFFLGKAAARDTAAGHRFFTAYIADF